MLVFLLVASLSYLVLSVTFKLMLLLVLWANVSQYPTKKTTLKIGWKSIMMDVLSFSYVVSYFCGAFK